MQPGQDKNEWQSPVEQPSRSPYAVPEEQSSSPTPVVSLAPDPMTLEEAEQDTQDEPPVNANAPVEQEPVHWQAHEYIHHEKSPIWFFWFTLVIIGLMVAAIFLMQSITFAILIPVMAAALIVYSRRPPRVLNYTLSKKGLHINDNLYPFAQFKGFGVIRDGEEFSVMLIPIKRFQPGVTVYFPEEAGEAIVDMLGTRLPMQELHLDMIDRVIRKLRI
jgi:hypothetical protein